MFVEPEEPEVAEAQEDPPATSSGSDLQPPAPLPPTLSWSLLSNYQRQCVVHFKSEGHRGAWGDCVVVSQLFSTSVCHSFQKSGSPLGFLVSACLQRPFGGLRLFRLNFELIINLFNFFRSSMVYIHVSIFECVGFEPGALRVRV